MNNIPKIIEGVDLFADQTASLQFLEDEELTISPEKQALICEIYDLVRKKAPEITPIEAYELFIFKFGVSLPQMNGMGLFEAKKWVESLEAQTATLED
jgi:hypothetical protein